MEKTNKELKNPVIGNVVTGIPTTQTITNKKLGTLKSKLQSTIARPQTIKKPNTAQK